ncbi:TPA: recombination protein NinG [Haemophilus influenzae]
MSKPKETKCKVCGKAFVKTFSSTQKVCSPECAIKLARDNAKKVQERAEKKKQRERKAKLKSRSEWLKEAQAVFNKFIRLRDKNEPCISCGRYHQGQYHAGHYRSVGACPELRFCELNVHKQCAPCNDHKSGNIIEYRINLVNKIGADKVAWLERQDHEPKKYTIEDCKVIIKHYKAKIKEQEGE